MGERGPVTGGSLAGRTLGPYRVLALLGRGGMGEVYRARDERLGRDVALKRLPPEVAGDPDRLRRFEREARALAALSHPHVATLYGLEEIEGTRLIAMELVEGEGLDARLARGALPVREALRVAQQVASGLEAAHEHGIVHRDLKPANLKLTADGRVKVLDFGLARPVAEAPGAGATHTEMTLDEITRGLVVGTAAYMSPEQARGLPVDRRSDVFAFGATLYELLSGRRAFAGQTTSDTLAHVLDREPDWTALPPDTPPTVRRLLHRCLRKDAAERLHDVADARLELEDALRETQDGLPAASVEERSAGVAAVRSVHRLAWLAAGLLIGAAAAAALLQATRRPTPPRRAMHFSVPLPAGCAFRGVGFSGSPLAISADGRAVVFVARKDDKLQLFRQLLGGGEAQAIPDTEGARAPFLSNDGRQVGYAVKREVKLRPVAFEPDTDPEPARSIALPVANVDVAFFGGNFSPKGDPLFIGECSRGIRSVSFTAGGPSAKAIVTEVLKDSGHVGMHQFPQALPDGKHLLYTWWNPPESEVRLLDLASGEERTLLANATAGHYVRSGHILYAWEGNLYAVPFDIGRLAVGGKPVRVVEGVRTELARGAAHFAVSDEGTLVYVPGGVVPNGGLPVWVGRDGRREQVLSESPAWGMSVSPDGTRIQFVRSMGEIWTYEPPRGIWRRLTDERGLAMWAQWTPDGRDLVFNFGEWAGQGKDFHAATTNLFRRPADASQPAERLTTNPHSQSPMSVSRDGRLLAYVEDTVANDDSGEGLDIWMLPLTGERTPRAWLATPKGETHPDFSPDGRWVAYASKESGDWYVMVRGLEGRSAVEQVSTEPGWEPLWSRDGKEILYRTLNGKKILAASFEAGPRPRIGRPRVLLQGNFFGGVSFGRTWAVAPDDQRFLVWDMGDPASAPPLPYYDVVLNFMDEVERKLATRAAP